MRRDASRVLLAMAAAGLALAAAAVLAQPPGGSWTPGAAADHRWREPVATAAALPSSGNVAGDVRLVIDEGELWCWLAGTWTACSGGGGGGVTDHGELTGLADDDHAGYALLAGRPGGQTLRGGTAAGEDLVIEGTAHSSRGDLILARGCVVLADDDPDVKLCPNDDAVFAGLHVRVHDASTRLEVRADSVTAAGNVRLYPDGSNGGVSVAPRGVFDADTGLGVPSSPSDELRLYAGGSVVAAAAKVAGVTTLSVSEALRLTPKASPPITCGAANTHGTLYTDDSSALCWCDGAAWQKVAGAGACS